MIAVNSTQHVTCVSDGRPALPVGEAIIGAIIATVHPATRPGEAFSRPTASAPVGTSAGPDRGIDRFRMATRSEAGAAYRKAVRCRVLPIPATTPSRLVESSRAVASSLPVESSRAQG